ncbi:MAG: isochorismatase family protein [Sphingomonadales bacterium]|jgi:nicotinamidase-related amidase
MVKWNVDKAADYSASGFGRALGFGRRPVLLVVDFVMAYLDPSSPLYAGVEKELEVLKRLVSAAREAHVQVIWTNVEYEPGGANGGHFYRKVDALKVFDRGGALGAFPEDLRPNANELVVTKQYPSAFFGTGLAEKLKALDVDTVFVTGLTTSGCVRASALDALQHGFIPIVISDACGDRDAEVQKANLFDLGAKYADIVRSDEVLTYLENYQP